MKIVAGAHIAYQVHRRCAERVVSRFYARGRRIECYTEWLVLLLMSFEFVPIAGRDGNAIPVVNRTARDLACQRIQTRVVLWALDAVLFEYIGIAHDVVPIMQDLDI